MVSVVTVKLGKISSSTDRVCSVCLAEIERERLYSIHSGEFVVGMIPLVVRIEETDRGFDRPEWVLQVS